MVENKHRLKIHVGSKQHAISICFHITTNPLVLLKNTLKYFGYDWVVFCIEVKFSMIKK